MTCTVGAVVYEDHEWWQWKDYRRCCRCQVVQHGTAEVHAMRRVCENVQAMNAMRERTDRPAALVPCRRCNGTGETRWRAVPSACDGCHGAGVHRV